MTRCLALLVALVLCTGVAHADWPTTDFVPFPNRPSTGAMEDFVTDGLPGFATGAETGFNATGETITVETLDLNGLMAPAAAPLRAVLDLVGRDAALLESAGFVPPILDPLITVASTGAKFFPFLWINLPQSDPPMKYGCYAALRLGGLRQIPRVAGLVNNSRWSYAQFNAAWNSARPWARSFLQDYMTATFIHEIVHGVQKRHWLGEARCDNDFDARKWLAEGMADGIAHHLLAMRRPAALEDWRFPRNERRYDVSLNAGGSDANNYGAGSFFRYLMEGISDGVTPGLPIVRRILETIPKQEAENDAAILQRIDAAIAEFAGTDSEGAPRTLYNVYPEFLTEYASYGGSRYRTDPLVPGDPAAPMLYPFWLRNTFGGCEDFALTPKRPVRKTIDVNALAGSCIRISWSGYDIPVSLQLYANGVGFAQLEAANLFVGEAIRKDATGESFCANVTMGLPAPRLERTSSEKCILQRSIDQVNGRDYAFWTLDRPISGTGEVYLIVSNIAKQPETTEDMSLELLVGALGFETVNTNIQPRAPSGTPPVENGLANLDARVHVLNANERRALFDGRSIDGPGPGLALPSGVQGDGTIGQGVLSIVRSRDYWVGFLGTGPAQPNYRDGAFIVKNPAGYEANLHTPGGLGASGMMAAMAGSAVSGGMMGEFPMASACGYDIAPEIRVDELSDDALIYHIEGDLFDFSKAMTGALGGATSQCGVMAAMHDGRANVTVTIPFGTLYDGHSTIVEMNPPGQASHKANFPRGPSFGGIETARTLAAVSTGWQDHAGGMNGSSGSDAGGASAAGNTLCSCGCPSAAVPETPSCQAQCQPVWQACRASPLDRFSQVLDRQGLDPSVARMLQEDFGTLSPDTQDYLMDHGN